MSRVPAGMSHSWFALTDGAATLLGFLAAIFFKTFE
jgi:hypothetical protein